MVSSLGAMLTKALSLHATCKNYSGKFSLQPGVNVPGPAAFRRIAGDILEISFLMTSGTFFRRLGRGEGVLTIAATPVCQVALGADIPSKFP